MRSILALTAACALVVSACGDGGPVIVDAAPDAPRTDGAVVELDAAAIDAPAIDAPEVDAAAIDAPIAIDAATIDAPAIDAAATDAATIDAAAAVDAAPAAVLLGPIPYLRAADSPFAAAGLATFYLEDFEDGVLDTPGVTVSPSQQSSSFGTSLIDSVDDDDGVVDGTCQVGCDARFGPGFLEFTFDAVALGGLPTHAGVVWTDGGVGALVTFEAFDAGGTSLGVVSAPGLPDGGFTGGTAEDRFFGAIYAPGIARIRIANSSGGTEADHLQYGR